MTARASSPGSVGTVGVLAVGVGTFDLDLGAAHCAAAFEVLGRTATALIGDPAILTDGADVSLAADRLAASAVDAVVVLQATFCDARSVIEVATRTGAPVLVWSFPEPRTGGRLRLNSLCGANLASYSLRRRGHPAAFVHADPRDVGADDLLDRALRQAGSTTSSESVPTVERPDAHDVEAAHRVAEELRGAVVGVIGDPPAGFEPCQADDGAVAAVCGVAVERVALAELFAAADRAGAADVETARDRAASTLSFDDEVPTSGLEESLRLYRGLRGLADGRGWAALSTRCWPECMVDYGGAVCTPQAMMTEDGVPAVCEADLLGSITALVLQRVAGSDPFLADLVDVDPDDDTCVLWHCGVASSRLAAPGVQPVGITHPNRHRALVSQFALRPGPVTVARISQAVPATDPAGMLMVVATGEILDRPRPFSGTCGVIRWDRPAVDVVASVLHHGLEHHLCVVDGDHRATLVALAETLGIGVIDLTAPVGDVSADGTTPVSR